MEQQAESPKYQVLCKRLNPAKMLCISGNCQQSAPCCMKEDCEVCRQAHPNCKLLKTDMLIKKVSAKRQQVTEQILKGIKAMQKSYDEAIDRLSKDKEFITSQMDMFGYNQFEVEFMMKLQDGIANQITGKMNAKIIENMGVKRDWVATEETISKYWSKKQKTFEQIFNKFKNVMTIGIPMLDSKITDDIQTILQFLGDDLTFNIQKISLLFRASENNFDVNKFHTTCDGKKHTIVLAKTEFGRIIGGYTHMPWTTNGTYGQDTERKSFLFSLTNKEKYPNVQTMYGNYGNLNYGPTFGGGHDFYISANSSTTNTSYFNFPHSYNNGKYVAGLAAQTAFCGSTTNYNARVMEWEVFHIQLM